MSPEVTSPNELLEPSSVHVADEPKSRLTGPRVSELQWHIPNYEQETNDEALISRRTSQIPPDSNTSESRRGSARSDFTLTDAEAPSQRPFKSSFSSYKHPYDIRPPQSTYPLPAYQTRPKRSISFADQQPTVHEYAPDTTNIEQLDPQTERALKRRGIPSNMLDLYAIDNNLSPDVERQASMRRQDSTNSDDYVYTSARHGMRRFDSTMSTGSDFLDPDDPRVTGIEAKCLEDAEDVEKNMLRQMDYRARRKHLRRIRIEFNVSCTGSLPFFFSSRD